MIKIAIVQKRPIYYDLAASLELATSEIKQAAELGVNLISFGETWLTGYPAWIDYLPNIALWNFEPTKQAYQLMHENAVEIPSAETCHLADLAKRYRMVIVMGVNEKAGAGTLYNSLLLFNQEGELAIHHRKLMPTYTEKLLYGMGDGHGLQTLQTDFGKIGGLICWEHWMPLTRQAMHNASEHIHVAVWPTVNDLHQLASRHYAVEGRCFVIATGQLLQVKDLPTFLPLPSELKEKPEFYLLRGGSSVIAPDGSYVLMPQFELEELLVIDLEDLQQTIRERMTLDVTKHYQRLDIFDFNLNRERK